jgi:hypothetical protein
MAAKRRTSTSTRDPQRDVAKTSPTAEFSGSLAQMGRLAKTAARHRFKLGTHSFYGPKAHDALVEIRRRFLELRAAYPPDRSPAVSAHLDSLTAPLGRLEDALHLDARDLEKIVRDASYIAGSDLRTAIEAAENKKEPNSPFITPEVLEPGVYRKVLEEANWCFAEGCPNACAAMLRRLVESLIIEAFEAHGIEASIKDASGEYLELKALIGKATAEPKLKLTRNTRNALPRLKFLGDLSVHARRNLVRSGDLKDVRNDARAAIEELASHVP